MNQRLWRIPPFFVLLLSIAACTRAPDAPKVGIETRERQTSIADIGSPLFSEEAWPKLFEDPSTAADPIRVPNCHLTVLDRVEVPSKEDGTVAWLGIEATPDMNVDPKDIFVHQRTDNHAKTETKTPYSRLRPGQWVKRGQVIALLNDDRAVLECDIAKSNIKGAIEEAKAASDAIRYYEANVDIEKKAGSSTSAIVAAQANLAKAIAEKASKEWTVERTRGEDKKSLDKLNNHFIRAPFDGEIVQFVKHVGEGVKAGEAVLQIQNTSRLGIEGNLEVQFARKVAVGSDTFLEPSIMEPPLAMRSPHASSKPITAVAAGMRDKKQVIISASEDGNVHVWEKNVVHTTWKHPAAVRAVAVTRPDVQPGFILTGCDDGKARLYSLSDLGQEPVLTFSGLHEGGVPAAAFSPNGEFCVTADDRGGIFLFETATGKQRYSFPREHIGPVSSLNFTPQCRVVSAGRDNVVLVWKVGEKAAAVETTFENRSGDVTNLGVTEDGGQMLLDLDKNRLRVIDLATKRNQGTLQQSTDNKFSTFALISPKIGTAGDRVILTTGSQDGVLQLWRWTTDIGRGSEMKKMVCTGYTTVTCAAFSPVSEDGFIVAGTRKGDVCVWPMPVDDEIVSRFKARITHVSPNLESSGKTVRIHAEYDNSVTRFRLRPGSTATMVIPQK